MLIVFNACQRRFDSFQSHKLKFYMQLKSVKIGKKDTCLTYALKRTGLDYLELSCTSNIEKFFNLIDFSLDKLKIGDIIYFSKYKHDIQIPIEIDSELNLLTHNVSVRNHCCVYEGNGIFTDCTKSEKEYLGNNCLRIRKFEDFKYEPSFILSLKQNF